jgi:hypothetical protein
MNDQSLLLVEPGNRFPAPRSKPWRFLKCPWLVMPLIVLAFLFTNFSAVGQTIDKLEQGANGKLTSVKSPVDWVTGNVNEAKAHYSCGMTIPYRLSVSGLVPGQTYQVTLGYDTKKNGKHAIDILTSFWRPNGHDIFGHAPEIIQPLDGFTLDPSIYNDYALPRPTYEVLSGAGFLMPTFGFDQEVISDPSLMQMRIYNGTISGMEFQTDGMQPDEFVETTSDYLVVNFQVNPGQSQVVLAWGGRIACEDQWGPGLSAADITGSPYHMFVHNCVNLSGCGNKEVQLSATAVLLPPACRVVGPDPLCGNVEAVYSTEVIDPALNPTYSWEITNNVSGSTNAYIVGANNGSSVTVNSGTLTGSFTLIVTVTITDGGDTTSSTCDLTIVVTSVILTCPEDVTEASCQTQEAINAKFDAWLLTVSLVGSDEIPTNNWDGQYPLACGGEKSVTFTVTDPCADPNTCTATFTVTPDVTAPVLPDLPAGGFIGCNPTELPACVTDLIATDNCGPVPVTCVPGEITGPDCDKTQIFTYSAVDECGNKVSETVTYTWKVDLAAPVLPDLPEGGYLGCNPTPPTCTEGLIANDVCDGEVAVICDAGEITGDCIKTQVFTYSAEDACGNEVSETVTYTWKVDLAAPVLPDLPEGGYLGCNPTELPVCDRELDRQ